MKILITFLILIFASFAKAQIVNIPDANFKAALISKGADTNNDGEIQQAEANAVTDLQLPLSSPDTIKDLTGIRSFTNLEKLDCSEQYISTLDVSGLSKLQQVVCPINLVLLNVSNCINLGGFDLGFNDRLRIINAENCARLKTVSLVQLFTTAGMDVNLINCDSLVSINIGFTFISRLNISQSDQIRSLTNVHAVRELIARNCLSLTEVTNGPNGSASFQIIDVTGCTNLETLAIGEGMEMNDVDLSTCPNIKNLFISGAVITDRCLGINLKNGTQMVNCTIALSGSNTGLPTCLNICADDFEIDSASNWLHFVDGFGAALVNINSYCTFTPAAAYNSIKGKVRISTNNSCDSSRAMPNVPILITDTIHNTVLKYTELTGNYNHYFYTGHYTIRPYFPYPYFSISPTTATANFDTANSLTATRDFCIVPNGVHNDLEITFLPAWPPARPGFDAGYTLVYKNRGTTTLSGSVQVNFDNNKMNFISASENIMAQSTGQLTWNYNNLQPFESRTIYVTFNLLPPPVNNIGDTITYISTITPNANDETPFDNNFILPQLVRGAIDPNEKQCLEHSSLDVTQIDQYLHYVINFQNEGTDTAFNIVVADTLSDRLDWNTLELISSSHPVDVKVTNNKAEFIFQNIQLPYKGINEPGSHGWVSYQIKPKTSVVTGDSINNKAAIYFDFNAPVITNTVTTVFDTLLRLLPVKLEYFSGNSSNNKNVLSWKASSTYGNATFLIERSSDGIHFSSIGNITATSTRCQLPFTFTDNNPVAGKNYYRLKITDADGISFYSKTLVIGNNKAGLAIRAIANDIVYLSSNKQQTIQIKVISADGKEILNERKIIVAGNNNISLQMKSAAKGIYTLVVYTNEGEIITKRFVK